MSDTQSRRQLLHSAARVGLGGAGMVLLGGCAVGPGRAPAARVATIGYLSGGADEGGGDADDSPNIHPLREGLRELGWVEGENMRLEVRLAYGDPAAAPDLAAELVRIPVDVIVAQGSFVIPTAAAATGRVPVVMHGGPQEAVELGLAASIQRPGGHVTGLLQSPRAIAGKRLELLLEAVPHVSRVAYLASSESPAITGPLRETARTLGLQVDVITVRSERDLALAFAAIDREAVEAVLVQNYSVTVSQRAPIVDSLAQRRLPAMYGMKRWAETGGLMSYNNDSAASARRAAFYVDRILRGATPGDLPIEAPTRYEFVINQRTAGALGLTIPDTVLAQATEVIR